MRLPCWAMGLGIMRTARDSAPSANRKSGVPARRPAEDSGAATCPARDAHQHLPEDILFGWPKLETLVRIESAAKPGGKTVSETHLVEHGAVPHGERRAGAGSHAAGTPLSMGSAQRWASGSWPGTMRVETEPEPLIPSGSTQASHLLLGDLCVQSVRPGIRTARPLRGGSQPSGCAGAEHRKLATTSLTTVSGMANR